MDPVEAAKNALLAVLEVLPGERVLVVADDARVDVAGAFCSGGVELGAWVRKVVLETGPEARTVPPSHLVETLLGGPRPDVLLNFLRGPGEETPFRVALLKLESRLRPKPRLGHCPGTTLDMLSGGALAMTAEEHREMQAFAQRLIDLLDGAESVHLTAPGGTDCVLGVAGRTWWTETALDWQTMKWMNLPTGEVLVAPLERGPGAWTGTLVCDAAMGGWPGPVPAPVVLHAREGRVERVECDHDALKRRVEDALATDEWARRVGEFAFGINPKARIHEEFVETEKVVGVHVAVGNNLDYPGTSLNASATHLDFLVREPTVDVNFPSGRSVRVMEGGRFVTPG
ncbi:MAG: hypothetical protein Kow0069_24850 [Promethearchaeota archaeon]